MPYLLRLQQVASVLSPSSPPSAHAPVVEYIAPTHTVFTPRHTGIGVLGASASDLCRTFLQLQQVASTLSLSSPQSAVVPVVIYIALAPALHAAPYLQWSTSRRHHQCPCTCACHGVPRAGTSSVLRASTSTGVLRACVFSICRTFCDCSRELNFSPCRAHRLHLHLWWSTFRRHQQFMLHLRLSWCTSR